MADNTARINEIRTILQSGIVQSTEDGTQTILDIPSLRAELQQLMSEDDTQKVRKPRISTIDCSRLR